MTSKANLGPDHPQRLNRVAKGTFNELAEIPTARSDLEGLIQALSEASERLSAVTYKMLHPGEPEGVAAGNAR